MRNTLQIFATISSLWIFVSAGCSQVGASAAGPRLVIYTNLDEPTRAPVLSAFAAQHPEAEITAVELDAAFALARIRSEADPANRGRAVASVWWGADDVNLDRAAAAGLLASSNPAWARSLTINLRDEKSLWSGLFLQPFTIAYRRGASDIPAKMYELADPRYRGRIVFARPSGTNTAALFLGSWLVAHGAGTAGANDRSMDWIWMLDANRGDDFANDELEAMDRVATGAGEGAQDITIVTAATAERARIQKKTVEFTIPGDAPAFVAGIAKLSAAPQPALADSFIEFAGRDEHSAHYMQRGLVPLPFERVEQGAAPAWMRDASNRARVQDRSLVSQSLSNWILQFESRTRSGAPLTPTEESGVWWMGLIDVVGSICILFVLYLLMRRGNWSNDSQTGAGGSAAAPRKGP